MTISTENFLKAIYLIQKDDDTGASASEIARHLDISNAAVTDMSRNLSSKGLIIYEKYKNLILTKTGADIAIRTIRRHRLWETFLKEVLDVPIDKVHDEAESLEHHMSEYLMDKIDGYLGFPDFDPHGDPIPDSKGEFPDCSDFIQLSDIDEEQTYKITRIEHHRIDILLKLRSLNLLPGERISFIRRFDDDGSLVLKTSKEKVIVEPWLFDKVMVKPLKSLFDIKVNESAIIEDVVAEKYQKRRFLDLGFVKGTSVSKVMKAPSGDPCSYEIRGTVIALRNDEASKILIDNNHE
ncbi:MAG: DtxR family transcriptional regulator [Hyphomicrobiales bacterium]